jgi:hypothetical protein
MDSRREAGPLKKEIVAWDMECMSAVDFLYCFRILLSLASQGLISRSNKGHDFSLIGDRSKIAQACASWGIQVNYTAYACIHIESPYFQCT